MSDEPQPHEPPKAGPVQWAEREAAQCQRNAQRIQYSLDSLRWWQRGARRTLRAELAHYAAQAAMFAELARKYGAKFDRADS